MKSITPELMAPIVRVAEEQPEYEAVDVARVAHPGFSAPRGWNTVVMAFRPDEVALAQLVAGEDLYVALLTFGDPQQPILLFVGREAAGAGLGVAVTERAPCAPTADVRHVLAQRAPAIAELLTTFGDAHFDCGEWSDESDRPYAVVSRAAADAERALAAAVLALLDRAEGSRDA